MKEEGGGCLIFDHVGTQGNNGRPGKPGDRGTAGPQVSQSSPQMSPKMILDPVTYG